MSTHQLPTATSLEPLAQHLVQVTCNLGRYVEEQAQMIAKPKIEAAEDRFRAHAAYKVADAIRQAERAQAVADELRRQITALQKQQVKALERASRIREVANEMDAQGLTEAADAVRRAVNSGGA